MPIDRPASAGARLPVGARRAALLEHLRATGEPSTVAALADAMGLHPNTVRAHLDLLVRSGEVERTTEVRATRGRPRELYRAATLEATGSGYALLASMLAAQLEQLVEDAGAEGVRTGRRWSAREDERRRDRRDDDAPQDAVGRVLAVLTDSGFEPELSADGRRVLLHACPFRDVARAHTSIVCGAHLGLIQGTLDRAGADVTATRLVPFVEPRLCVAELGAVPR